MASSEPPDRPDQPLWRGQTAPVEGAADTTVAPRRAVHPVRWTVLGAIVLVAFAVAITLVVQHLTPERLELRDLSPGDCLAAEKLSDTAEELAAAGPEVVDLQRVDCDALHSAEVFAVLEAGADAETLSLAGQQCADAAPLPLAEIAALQLEVRPVALDLPVKVGDPVVCLARDVTGDGLTAPTMMGSLDTDAED